MFNDTVSNLSDRYLIISCKINSDLLRYFQRDLIGFYTANTWLYAKHREVIKGVFWGFFR